MMLDREKVIKAWEIFRDSNPYEICSGREFRAIREPEYCMGQMIEDTIELLKEQESEIQNLRRENHDILTKFHEWAKEQEAILVDAKVVGTSHGDMEVYCCRDCRTILDPAFHYCPHCGKAVKWNGD